MQYREFLFNAPRHFINLRNDKRSLPKTNLLLATPCISYIQFNKKDAAYLAIHDTVDMPFRKLLNYLTLIPYGLIVTRLGIVLPKRTTPQSICKAQIFMKIVQHCYYKQFCEICQGFLLFSFVLFCSIGFDKVNAQKLFETQYLIKCQVF